MLVLALLVKSCEVMPPPQPLGDYDWREMTVPHGAQMLALRKRLWANTALANEDRWEAGVDGKRPDSLRQAVLATFRVPMGARGPPGAKPPSITKMWVLNRPLQFLLFLFCNCAFLFVACHWLLLIPASDSFMHHSLHR